MKNRKKIYWGLSILCLIATSYFAFWWYCEIINQEVKKTPLEPILFSLGFGYFSVFFMDKATGKGN